MIVRTEIGMQEAITKTTNEGSEVLPLFDLQMGRQYQILNEERQNE